MKTNEAVIPLKRVVELFKTLQSAVFDPRAVRNIIAREAVKIPITGNGQGIVFEWDCDNQSVNRFNLDGEAMPFKNLGDAPLQSQCKLSDRGFLESAKFFGKIFGYRLVQHTTKTKNGIRVTLMPE